MPFWLLILYEGVLWILAICTLPLFLYSLLVKGKYRHSLLYRLTVKLPSLVSLSGRPTIWLHAVSVGETRALVGIARALKEYFPHYPLLISSTTETGYAEACRTLSFADLHFYLPLDFRLCVQRMVTRLNPTLLVLSESDIWPNLLWSAKQHGARLAVINGKLSERSMKRFHFFPSFSRLLFSSFDVLCVQDECHRCRLESVGAPPPRLHVTGNLKGDEIVEPFSDDQQHAWRKHLQLGPTDSVVVLGSTHHEEEDLLLKALDPLWRQIASLRLIIVPRHPERFAEVERLLHTFSHSWCRFTDLSTQQTPVSIILLNAMGYLRQCYAIADCAIVGGSFVPHIGGHNILEPCQYGKPVLFGPYMEAQRQLAEWVQEGGAGWQLPLERLAPRVAHLLTDPNYREEVGARGKEVMARFRGATEKTLRHLVALLSSISSEKLHNPVA